MSGSRLEESVLLLELLLDKGTKIKNIVLEIDLNINSNKYSESTRVLFYPYLRKSKIISDYYRHISGFNNLYNIPFYRYMKYDAKIGIRELFFTATSKPTRLLESYGFYGLDNQGKKMSYDLSKSSPKRNKGYEKIKELCEINKIRLISVTTPMCKNITNPNYFNEVVKLYPEIYNMENTITDESCFSSCGHMNKKGALLFTQKILDKFFN